MADFLIMPDSVGAGYYFEWALTYDRLFEWEPFLILR